MVYLTCDDLIELNSWATALFGGIDGVRDFRALESCAAQPKTLVFGHERFRDPHEKAAAYCFFLSNTSAVCNRIAQELRFSAVLPVLRLPRHEPPAFLRRDAKVLICTAITGFSSNWRAKSLHSAEVLRSGKNWSASSVSLNSWVKPQSHFLTLPIADRSVSPIATLSISQIVILTRRLLTYERLPPCFRICDEITVSSHLLRLGRMV